MSANRIYPREQFSRDDLLDTIREQEARIDTLTDERDGYLLKQKVWEEANDDLRSEHIRLTRENQELRRKVNAHPLECEFSDSRRHECKHCDAVGFAPGVEAYG